MRVLRNVTFAEEGEQLLRKEEEGGGEAGGDDASDGVLTHARHVAVGFVSTVVVLGICAVVAVSVHGGGGGGGGGGGIGSIFIGGGGGGGISSVGEAAAVTKVFSAGKALPQGAEEMLQLTSVPDDFVKSAILTRGDGEEDGASGAATLGTRVPAPKHSLDANVFTISIGGLEVRRAAHVFCYSTRNRFVFYPRMARKAGL